jgi:hypothetical protein
VIKPIINFDQGFILHSISVWKGEDELPVVVLTWWRLQQVLGLA